MNNVSADLLKSFPLFQTQNTCECGGSMNPIEEAPSSGKERKRRRGGERLKPSATKVVTQGT